MPSIPTLAYISLYGILPLYGSTRTTLKSLFSRQIGRCSMVRLEQIKLLHYIDSHLTSYVERWHQLARQQLSHTDLPDNQQFLTLLTTNLQPREQQNLLVSKQHASAELTVAAPHTLLFHHNQPPDIIHCAALLSALDACKNTMGSIPINIQWLLAKGAAQEWEMLTPDGCINYYATETGIGNAGTPVLASGTKGRLRIELTLQTINSTIDSMHGGIAPDSLWRLLWALGTLKDAREDILIEGFYDTVAPASDDMIAQLHILPDTSAELAQRWGLPQLLMGLHGFQLHYAHLLLPTCTLSSIITTSSPISTVGEQTETVLPGQTKALVDFYLVPDQNPQDIFSKLQSHLLKQGFSDVQVRILSAARPLSTPVSDPFLQLAIAATEQAYAQKPFILPGTVGNYTPSAPWMKDGTPVVFIARNEQNSEHDTAAFMSMIKQIALIIEGMANGTDTAQ